MEAVDLAADPTDPTGPTDRQDDRNEGSRLRHAVALVRRVRRLTNQPRIRRWLLPCVALVFLAMAIGSFVQLVRAGTEVRLILLPLLILVTPPTVLANAVEFQVMAAIVGRSIPIKEAIRVSVQATMANYLPAPGGVAIRTVALCRRGTSVRRAVLANGVVGMVWVAVTALASGTAFFFHEAAIGVVLVACGSALLTGTAVMLRRAGVQAGRSILRLTAVEAFIVGLAAVKIWMALAALGESIRVSDAIILSGAGVITAAIGLAPAGLGIREAITGGLGALVGLPVATTVAASAMHRVAGQLAIGIIALVAGVRRTEVDSAAASAAQAGVEGGSVDAGGVGVGP